MPFRERSIVLEREEFCRLASDVGANFRALCRGWGISPTTGYKWLGRWQSTGRPGLADRPRRPQRSPARCEASVEEQILAVRREHPAWGGRKIRHVLVKAGFAAVPAASTITAVLRRHGLLDGPRAGMARAYQRFEREHPNELWQMDFKGHFATAQGRCHPLTVLDDHSRYALVLSACANEQGETVRERLEQAFRRYGLPQRILTDNGPPWGAAGVEAHTPLTVWLLDLDVANLADCHAAFDTWREVYTPRRPHEALEMKTPIDRYPPSSRSMPATIEPPDYDQKLAVRKVQ